MTDVRPTHSLLVPPRKTGVHHVLASAGYSLHGGRRLLRETAARHEILLAAVGFAALLIKGTTLLEIVVFFALTVLLFAVEALNTAIEILTDHVSPEWSEAAKQAKDLGSLACALLIAAVVVAWGYMMVF